MTQADMSSYSFAALHNRLVITGVIETLTAIRIGAGRSRSERGSDLPVLRDALNRPFIPGASLKGALRARAEALVRSIAPAQARDLPELEAAQRDIFGPLRDARQMSDAERSARIWKGSTLIELVFGAPWLAGRLFVRDAAVEAASWFGQHEIRNGVGLNRDTESAEDGLLYNYEVTPAGTRFGFQLVLENSDAWQRGLITLLLKPWERGDVQIGGFRSRGLGHIQLKDVVKRFTPISDVDSIISLLLDEPAQSDQAATDDLEREWVKAFRDKLEEVQGA